MLVDIVSSSSLLFPLIAGLAFYYRNGKLLNFFLVFILFSAVFESISLGLAFSHINNHWMFKLFLISDFLFFALLFNKRLTFKPWFRHFTLGFLVLILCDGFITLIWPQLFAYPGAIIFVALFLYFIIQSIYVLLTLINDMSLLQNTFFWIATARLFSYLTIFSIYTYVQASSESFNNQLFSNAFKIINASSNIVCNIMFGVSFLCNKIRI